jgi:hypothetical protein
MCQNQTLYAECHFAEHHYSVCSNYAYISSVVILSVILLSIIILCVVIMPIFRVSLSVTIIHIMLSVAKLNAIVFNSHGSTKQLMSFNFIKYSAE